MKQLTFILLLLIIQWANAQEGKEIAPDQELNTFNKEIPTYRATPAKLPMIAPIVPNKTFPFFIISPLLFIF